MEPIIADVLEVGCLHICLALFGRLLSGIEETPVHDIFMKLGIAVASIQLT
jgi:hypothetical protein